MSDTAKSAPSAQQNLIGGALSIAFGIFVLAIASRYPMGSLLRMGPGFFPCIIASLILLLGIALFISGLRVRLDAAPVKIQWRSVLAIASGVILFAVSLERIGLVPATLALVLVSSLAEPGWKLGRAAILAVVVTALVYLLFVAVLQIPVAAVSL
jgi:Tripartite tricarboxylate transporter TctB family